MVKNTLSLKWPISSQSLNRYTFLSVLFSLVLAAVLSSCSKLGYGVLLWSVDEPHIDSGTVLPVYIKSNIEKLWVVGVPDAKGRSDNKVEIPLTQLEFVGSKRKAEKRAFEFSQHATTYAENLQDRLPIRDAPDNNSRQVYRLRVGEIIKVLGIVDGSPPIGVTGDPLPGDWLRVLTHDGVRGFCFSYRLKIFEQTSGSVVIAPEIAGEIEDDPDLEMLLSRNWSPESYLQMINSRRLNISELERNYRFEPGSETGIARIILPNLERQFTFERIVKEGDRAWRFEGTSLQMVLRTSTTLAVHFTEADIRRTVIFNALPSNIDNIIIQETARREMQFMAIYEEGPVFTSSNYGTITFLQTGDFTWTGYRALVPHLIPEETSGTGRINMDIYITRSLEERYSGAFTLQFTDIRSNNTRYFMYAIDSQGLRLEEVPEYGIEGITVTRRASSPTVLYFFRDSAF